MIVDDDALPSHPRRMLVHAGFDVIEASDRDAGIEAYRRGAPDVALIDLPMPLKDGLTAIREILGFAPAAGLIAMSGMAHVDGVDCTARPRAAPERSTSWPSRSA